MYDGTELRAFTAQRVGTANDRGVGAAFSAAIAAGLANGLEVRDAVSQAKKYVTGALRHALPSARAAGRQPLPRDVGPGR